MSRIGLENPLLTQFIHRLTESYPFHLLPFVSSLIPLIISFFLSSQRRIISIQLSESHLFYLFSLLSLNLSYQSIMPTVLSSQLIILLFLPITVIWRRMLLFLFPIPGYPRRLWSQLPVLTATLPILPLEQLQRQSIPFIHDFGSSFKLVATGITSPLRVTCVAHDGSNFNQILKKDEIRSDCVVQQLFELLNRLLAEKNCESQNPSFQDIHLRIYRVSQIEE